jgi:Family of unknown function (DUF6118)
MIATPRIDDQPALADHVLAELDAIREQLSAIEAALPDYGPSFSALEQYAQKINAAVDKIAASPSVTLSAAQHASKSTHAISELLTPSLAKLQKAIEGTDERQAELIRLTNALHVRSMYRPFPWLWPAAALVAGFWLYPLIATTVPGGSHLAALATGHRDRWAAGGALMSAANPQSWAEIVRASQVLEANQEVFGRCFKEADTSSRPKSCAIIVGPNARRMTTQ